MKVGDLVKIKYNGKLAIVTKVNIAQDLCDGYGTTVTSIWVHLHNERMTFKAEKLEVINE